MTNPIPGADSERALPPLPDPKHMADGHYGYTAKHMAEYVRADRAAAKVGANVAADELHFNAQRLRNVAHLVGLEGAIPEDDATLDGARAAVLGMIARRLRGEAKLDAFAAGAPAETPKPEAYGVYGINGRGQTYLHEAKKLHDDWRGDDCGLGERWAGNDALVPAIAAQPSPAPIAGDVEKDALDVPQQFLDYVAANYNGVIDIHRPEWHAKRLWKAAISARAAMLANSSSGEAG